MDEGRRLIASFAGSKQSQLRTDNRRTSSRVASRLKLENDYGNHH